MDIIPVDVIKSKQDRRDRGRSLTAYIAGAAQREYPPEVLDAAMRAFVDFLCVSVGAFDDAPVRPVRRTVERWNAAGNARIFLGGCTTPPLAALVNGTMAHAMDYDDTHPLGGGHPSGPCWSAALALADHHGLDEKKTIAAFITGYEIMAKLGGGGVPGVGRSLQRHGFHPTSVFGRVGAAAVACVLLGLEEIRIASALGIAATTAGGLVGSFGTHAKPFHAGKAAMDGIMAAQLAAEGFVAATHLFELNKGLLDAFIQDKLVEVPPLDFDTRWEILGNAFKPYASCRGTHPSIQTARALAGRVAGKKIVKVQAKVHPNAALVTCGKQNPQTPLDAKFSVSFCIALGLAGYRVVASDFTEATLRDPSVTEILPCIEVEAVQGQPPCSSHIDVFIEGGERLHADTDIVLGHPDNPMTWDELRCKFEGLVEPVLGPQKGAELYETARRFDRPGSLRRVMHLLKP